MRKHGRGGRGLTKTGEARTLETRSLPRRITYHGQDLTTPIVVPEAVRRKAGLRAGQPVEFRVDGRAITIVPKEPSDGDYPMDTVTRIVKEQTEKPMGSRRLAALDAEVRAYGAKQAKKVGVKERDVTRIVHESRARRRTP
jgi:bifunctional DNA-binding transcriptional regulator/antitoxin component of YhaV-PrlF toxin-antitoxin module